ncbi:MAG: Hsp20/alpha crystallin family protein [Lachnospiraceae bacterium]|nr:Hsp20/alpha crystallin family protein [Lachnospiraceae bacterium]
MLMPSIFGENLFDEMMRFPFENDFFSRRSPLYGKNAAPIMKTDIQESDQTYELAIDLPGFKKEEINAELKDGYLMINASKSLDQDEKSSDGRYIRRERYSGSMSRSFYVGEAVRQEDIKAKFENGILNLSIPKIDEQKKVAAPNYIAIEG